MVNVQASGGAANSISVQDDGHAYLSEDEALSLIRNSGSVYEAALKLMANPTVNTAIALSKVSDEVKTYTPLETAYNDLTSQLRAQQSDNQKLKNPEAFDALIGKAKDELNQKIKDLSPGDERNKFQKSLNTINEVWVKIKSGEAISREEAQGLANALLTAKELVIPADFSTESLGLKANQFREQYNLKLQRLKDAVRSINPQ